MAMQKTVAPFEWGYIDGFLNRFEVLEKLTVVLKVSKDNADQQKFRADMLRAYDAVEIRKIAGLEKEYTWCAITGDFQPPGSVCVAHIVRHSVGDVAAESLFGKPSHRRGHIWNLANGIPMRMVYEEALDKANLVIVPRDTPRSWKVCCMQGADQEDDITRQELTFCNDFQPLARYVYFRFATNILLRQRHDIPGWWNDQAKFGRMEM